MFWKTKKKQDRRTCRGYKFFMARIIKGKHVWKTTPVTNGVTCVGPDGSWTGGVFVRVCLCTAECSWWLITQSFPAVVRIRWPAAPAPWREWSLLLSSGADWWKYNSRLSSESSRAETEETHGAGYLDVCQNTMEELCLKLRLGVFKMWTESHKWPMQWFVRPATALYD